MSSRPAPAKPASAIGTRKPPPSTRAPVKATTPAVRKPPPSTRPAVVAKPAAAKPAAVAKPAARPAAPVKLAVKPAAPVRPSAQPTAPKAVEPERTKSGNWINRTVQNSVAGVGSYAGGFVNNIGATVNKVGEGIGGQISDRTRGWGQGVSGYGNNIKDMVGVGGPRIATGGNPLGIAGQGGAPVSQSAKKIEGGVKSGGRGSAGNPLGI